VFTQLLVGIWVAPVFVFMNKNSLNIFLVVILGFQLRASQLLNVLPLEPPCKPFFVLIVFELGSLELFAWAGLKP
jgi:hypothetical protein